MYSLYSITKSVPDPLNSIGLIVQAGEPGQMDGRTLPNILSPVTQLIEINLFMHRIYMHYTLIPWMDSHFEIS